VAYLDGHVEPGWSTGVVLVSPRAPWAGRSGLILHQGQSFRLSAGGQWTGNRQAVPEGLVPPLSPAPPRPELLAPDRADTALIARVGDGTPFPVGYGGEFTANASGELTFSMNDSTRDPRFWNDNRGLMWVFRTSR
jgi:hypothetical protein